MVVAALSPYSLEVDGVGSSVFRGGTKDGLQGTAGKTDRDRTTTTKTVFAAVGRRRAVSPTNKGPEAEDSR